MLDFSLLPYAGSVNDSSFTRTRKAVFGESSESADRTLRRGLACIGSRHDEVEIFVFQLGVARDRTVDQRFHLRVHRAEIDGRCQNDYVGCHHIFEYLRHIVLLNTPVRTRAAPASCAVTDGMITEEYLFGIISRFPRTADELIAERVGITALSRACGNDENFFAHAFSLFCSVQSAGMNYPVFSFIQ